MLQVLLVEDDVLEARTTAGYLERAGHVVTSQQSAEQALEQMRSDVFDVIVTDIHLTGMSGIDLLRAVRESGGPPVVVLTGDLGVSTVVEAMRIGAADYVTKPLTLKTLEHVLARVVEMGRLRRQVQLLAQGSDPDPAVTARSSAMRLTLELANRFAASSVGTALIVGESGAGKEVVAAYVHRQSPRAAGPFVRINLAALPESMLEAELFGAVRGAFTDARRDRDGFFAAAEGGTLLLDEITEVRPELQAKLLRAIETKRYYPVGASRERSANVRILAATNRDPEAEVARGSLRADLYYRLASIVIPVPPLRDRLEDLPVIAQALLARLHQEMRRGPRRFSDAALERLQQHGWPGNVRELRNVVERVAILVDAAEVDEDKLARCFPSGFGGGGVSMRPPPEPLRAAQSHSAPDASASDDGEPRTLETVTEHAIANAERDAIRRALARTSGNRSRAAEQLGVSRSTLWKKMRALGLE